MPPTLDTRRYVEHVVEVLCAGLAANIRRMFSGMGLFCDGVMFTIVVSGTLYLKTDAQTRSRFTDERMQAFTFERKGATPFC